MRKLRLELRKDELRTLAQLIVAAYALYPIQALVSNAGDYLVLSTVEDLLARLERKVRELSVFGHKLDQKYSITMKRHEAIGLLHILEAERMDGLRYVNIEEGSHTAGLCDRIVMEIQKTYFA